jgi:hypothetical protein
MDICMERLQFALQGEQASALLYERGNTDGEPRERSCEETDQQHKRQWRPPDRAKIIMQLNRIDIFNGQTQEQYEYYDTKYWVNKFHS